MAATVGDYQAKHCKKIHKLSLGVLLNRSMIWDKFCQESALVLMPTKIN